MKILNATYTYNPTHTTVFRTDFTIMFLNCYRKKATSFFERKVTDINELKIMFMSLLIKRIHMRPSFNSIYNKAVNTNQFPVLQQHFIGWFIKSDSCFNPARATFSWLRKRKHSFYVRAAYISHRSFTRIHLVFAWSLAKAEWNGNKRHQLNYQPLHNRKEQGSIPWLVTRSGKKYTKVLNIGTAGAGQRPVQGIHLKIQINIQPN
jgi:lycopene beta-cyclase